MSPTDEHTIESAGATVTTEQLFHTAYLAHARRSSQSFWDGDEGLRAHWVRIANAMRQALQGGACVSKIAEAGYEANRVDDDELPAWSRIAQDDSKTAQWFAAARALADSNIEHPPLPFASKEIAS
jgi:hypothetical protein